MARLSLKPGSVVVLARKLGVPTRAATIVTAGPDTIRYRLDDSVIRAMPRIRFMMEAHAALGVAYTPPKPRVRGVIVLQPFGGQPRTRKK